MALNNLEQRAADQQRLLAENERQQALIRDLSVPVLPLSASTVVMPLVGALDGERLRIVQAQALGAIERLSARRLLLDITGVPQIVTPLAPGLIQTLEAARLLGAEVVLVGVRPEVAQSVVGLGVDLHAMRSYADLQTALGAIGLDTNGRRAISNRPLG
jgi:rsbT co-antagonist protein RsbR